MCAAFKMQIDRNENKRNRLAAVTRNTLAYASYTYNALEQLTSRNTSAVGAPAGTVHYLYDQDGHLIAEANASTGATTRDYIWLASNDNDPIDLPLAIAETTTLTMVHADHLGRPTRMTDAARATVWQAIWKPWGEVHSLSGTLTQNLRYPGQYYQIETGLHYNHHRNYDPITGRYTQADPLRFVDGPSVYAYAKSTPLMVTDSTGLASGPYLKDVQKQNKCNAIRRRIKNLDKEIERQYSNIEGNLGFSSPLPERIGPGELPRSTVRGHRMLIDKYWRDRNKAYDEYRDNGCDDGGSGGGGGAAAACTAVAAVVACVLIAPEICIPVAAAGALAGAASK
jgi:RHS repeat-associated protein